jgi:prepilin-type N-terminal cleavage/methylation domain-containing protein
MRLGKQRGFSLIELIISIGILTLIVTIVLQYVADNRKQQLIMRAQNEMKIMNQQGLTRLSSNLSQAKRVFDRSGTGASLFAYNAATPSANKWELGNAPPPIPGSRLPYTQLIGSLAPERNCDNSPTNYFWPPAVGNTLAYAKLTGSFSDFPLSNRRSIDIYRFYYVYITDYANLSGGEKNYIQIRDNNLLPAQSLIEWQSVAYADYQQLQNYLSETNVTDQGAILNALRNSPNGAQFAWDTSVNNLVATGAPLPFYQISTSVLGSSGHRLRYQRYANVMRMKSDGEMVYSVAYNRRTENGAGHFPIRPEVPQFFKAVPDTPCPSALPTPQATTAADFSFPRGFEVMVVGPASGRKVMMYSTLSARTSFGFLASYPEIQITAVKDL